MQGSCEIQFGDERLWLLPDRAAWWPAQQALLIADTHFGKEATLRSAAIPIPDLTAAELSRLSRLIHQTGCRRLLILGDFLHARRGRSATLIEQLTAWRLEHRDLPISLVRGNHDLAAGDPPANWNIECIPDPTQFGSIWLAHRPAPDRDRFMVAGHLHPKVRLRQGPENLKLPCFVLRGRTLIFPAFARFVDHGLLTRDPDDEIFVVAGDHVLPPANQLDTDAFS